MTTKLVARQRVKFGSRIGATDHRGAVVQVDGTRNILPGEIFELDDEELAKRFLNDDVAMTRSTALEKAHAIQERGDPVPAEYGLVVAEGALTAEEQLEDRRIEAVAARQKLSASPDGEQNLALVGERSLHEVDDGAGLDDEDVE